MATEQRSPAYSELLQACASATEGGQRGSDRVKVDALPVQTHSSIIESQDSENTLKRMSRVYMSSFTGARVSVSRVRNTYFIAHLTNADLSMLSDFPELKEKLDIVNRSFVTVGKPIQMEKTNVFIRDTMLLTPAAGNKSLDAIGELYGLEKIKLSPEVKGNMDVLLRDDKKLFEEYATRDAIIPVVHANFMEQFNFQLNELGVPITLSNLGSKYVKHL